MGQKVNPNGFRLAATSDGPSWSSLWYAGKLGYSTLVVQDKKIRDFLEKRLASAGIVNIKIERFNKKTKITIVCSRPGLVIGRGGKELEAIKKSLLKLIPKVNQRQVNLDLQVEEFKSVDLSAKLVAEKIALQIAKRMPYRRVVLGSIEKSMAAGAKGVKIILAGRINGAEISRREKFSQGKVPLSTIKSKVDYHECPSATRSGYVGVKVYLCLA